MYSLRWIFDDDLVGFGSVTRFFGGRGGLSFIISLVLSWSKTIL